MECFPKLSKSQIYNHAKQLQSSILAEKNHPDSHLQEMLKNHPSRFWLKKEEETFIKMFKKYGKNYKLIKAKIPSKTYRQVRDYGYGLHRKIEANPKHKHCALKKKLKPKWKWIAWTEKELKQMLKGLQKYVGCAN